MVSDPLPEPFLRFLLAYQRAPLAHPQVGAPETSLPPELAELLERLGRQSGSAAFAAEAGALGVDPDELYRAALFFVKQTLFGDRSHPYRVLGLPLDCSAEDIRARYRLLVRIFHPDRLGAAGDWNERLATRLNEAYNVLKHPARRAELDRRLASAAAALGRSGAVRRRHGFRLDVSAPSFKERLHGSRLWRRHPVAVVWGAILVSVVVVLGVGAWDRLDALFPGPEEPATAVAAREPAEVPQWASASPAPEVRVPPDQAPTQAEAAGTPAPVVVARAPAPVVPPAVREHREVEERAPAAPSPTPRAMEPEGSKRPPLPSAVESAGRDTRRAFGRGDGAPVEKVPSGATKVPEPLPVASQQTEAPGGMPVAQAGTPGRPAPAVSREEAAPAPEPRAGEAPAAAGGPSPKLPEGAGNATEKRFGRVSTGAAGLPGTAGVAAPEEPPAAPGREDSAVAVEIARSAEATAGLSDQSSPARLAREESTDPAPVTTVVGARRAARADEPPSPANDAAGEAERAARSSAPVAARPEPPPVAGISINRRPARPAVSEADLSALVSRLIGAYHAGDLQAFLGLFSDDVASNAGKGKAALARVYESLFAATEERALQLAGLEWERKDPRTVRGWSDIRVRLVRRSAPQWPEDRTGKLAIAVRSTPAGPKITEFFHMMEGR